MIAIPIIYAEVLFTPPFLREDVRPSFREQHTDKARGQLVAEGVRTFFSKTPTVALPYVRETYNYFRRRVCLAYELPTPVTLRKNSVLCTPATYVYCRTHVVRRTAFF